MMLVACALGAGLVLIAFLLEESAAWFGRNALDLESRGPEKASEATGLAWEAAWSRTMGRFAMAVAFAGVALVALVEGRVLVLAGLLVTGLLVAILAASFSAVQWRSPLGIAGRAVYWPLRWVGVVLRGLVRVVGRLPGLSHPAGADERLVELDEERRWLMGSSFEDEQGEMLATLHDFGTTRVEDVMVPREEVVGVAAGSTLAEVLTLIEAEGFSRYPVYRDTLDHVTGVLHVFDCLGADLETRVESLARDPYLTPGTKPAGDLLRELQATYNQMAVVVDEYGGTAGLATIEDLLEELVGEIEDEHDEEEIPFRRLEPGVYWVEASMRVDDLNESLDLHLEEGDYDTLAGLMLDRLEHVPQPGERIRENGVWIEVAAAEPHRINAVRVIVADGEGDGDRS